MKAIVIKISINRGLGGKCAGIGGKSLLIRRKMAARDGENKRNYQVRSFETTLKFAIVYFKNVYSLEAKILCLV